MQIGADFILSSASIAKEVIEILLYEIQKNRPNAASALRITATTGAESNLFLMLIFRASVVGGVIVIKTHPCI